VDNARNPLERSSLCRARVQRTLRDKFEQTDEGLWREVGKSMHRMPLDDLVALAFYRRDFQPASAEGISDFIKDFYGSETIETSETYPLVRKVKYHLKNHSQRYERDEPDQEPVSQKPKTLWHIIPESKDDIEFQAKVFLQEIPIVDPGLTYPQLVVEAFKSLGGGEETFEKVYQWISRRYPYHLQDRQYIRAAFGRITSLTRGEYYRLKSDQLEGQAEHLLACTKTYCKYTTKSSDLLDTHLSKHEQTQQCDLCKMTYVFRFKMLPFPDEEF
jgi:hypothetical protein